MSKKPWSPFFEPFEVITRAPVTLCVDEVSIDEKNINFTGRLEQFEHGEYEMCEIRPGTKLWAMMTPDRVVSLFQHPDDHMCIKNDARAGVDFDWVDPANNPQALLDAAGKTAPSPSRPKPKF